MYAEYTDAGGERFVVFDSFEDVERAVDVFGLIFAKVEVDGVEDVVQGNGTVERGEEEPGSEVVARDVGCDPRPYFWWRPLRGWIVCEADLLHELD